MFNVRSPLFPVPLPFNYSCEIVGDFYVGKTTLALHLIKRFQKRHKYALYVDMERAFSNAYALSLGIDPEYLLIIKPDTPKDLIEQVCPLLAFVSLVVVDSITAVSSDVGEMNWFLRRLRTLLSGWDDVSVVLINQLRFLGDKVRGTFDVFVDQITTDRLAVFDEGKLLEGDQVVGHKLLVRRDKTPYRYDLVYGKGLVERRK